MMPANLETARADACKRSLKGWVKALRYLYALLPACDLGWAVSGGNSISGYSDTQEGLSCLLYCTFDWYVCRSSLGIQKVVQVAV